MPIRATIRRHIGQRAHFSSQIGQKSGIAQNAPKHF